MGKTWFADYWLRLCLACGALIGIGVAWWLYPPENRFSITRCTISFLGSPDPHRNPEGWRFYQIGMSSLLCLLFSLAFESHVRLRQRTGRGLWLSTVPVIAALGMILAATWIPDTREGQWFGMITGKFHTRIAICAIPVMAFGIAAGTVMLRRSGAGWLELWPVYLYALLTTAGIYYLAKWENMCRADPSLKHWPGEGLHSTPLWEWVTFSYLVAFLFWLAAFSRRQQAKQIVPEVCDSNDSAMHVCQEKSAIAESPSRLES